MTKSSKAEMNHRKNIISTTVELFNISIVYSFKYFVEEMTN